MIDTFRGKPFRHSQVAWRIFSGEAVIITPAENRVRMLNLVGSRIWELADGTRTVGDIVEVLTTEYDVDADRAQQTTLDLLAELTDKALILWMNE